MDPARSNRAITTYARFAGLLFFISIVAGGFGEGYAPSVFLSAGDALQTVATLKANEFLHRLSFAAYLAEACCDTALAAIFYLLLKPVSRGLALIAALFGVMATATYAACEIFYFALPHLLVSGAPYLNSFTPTQIAALTVLSFKLFNYAAGLFLVFYGAAWIIRGWLMMRSGYFPKLLAILMILGGLGFVARSVASVIVPQLGSAYMLMLLAPGGILLGLWLLIRGIDAEKWRALERHHGAAS